MIEIYGNADLIIRHPGFAALGKKTSSISPITME